MCNFPNDKGQCHQRQNVSVLSIETHFQAQISHFQNFKKVTFAVTKAKFLSFFPHCILASKHFKYRIKADIKIEIVEFK